MQKEMGLLERVFHLSENGTSVKTEIMAGITTFMTMAYILAVNPNILSASGMDSEAVLIATALASFVGTALMALLANYPFALAPGMGLNAYFSYTVVLTMGYSWQLALMAVFVEGIIFIVLSLTNVREGIFNAIPMTLKSAVSVGIGLFVAFVGLQNAKLIVNSDSTLVTYQHFKGATFHSVGVGAILALLGVVITAILLVKKVKGGILYGILITWLLGIVCELTGIYVPDVDAGMYSVIPTAFVSFDFSALGETFGQVFKTDFSGVGLLNFFAVMFSFLFVDLFDTLGTLIGVASKADMLDEDGRLLAVKTMKIREVSDPDALTDTLVALTRELAQEGGVPMEEIASVGAGVPGVVDIRTGSIVYTCNLPLRNIPLRKLFKRRLGLHLYVENDANCAALAEYHAGAGRGSKRFVTITLGTGIGAGIIHNGKIFHGGNGMAGEVGHTCIDYQGLPCPCGRRGCWEQYASASALKRFTAQAQLGNPDSILARVIREHDGHVSGQSAFMAARLGDPVGQQVCDMYVGYLAAGIANVVNIFQPDTLAIGGGVSNESDEQLLHPLQQLVERETIPCSAGKKTRIVKAQLGNQAGIIGAALLGKKKRI